MSRRGVQTSAWRPSICIGAVIGSSGYGEGGTAACAHGSGTCCEFDNRRWGCLADGDFFLLVCRAGAVVVGYANFIDSCCGDVEGGIGLACHGAAILIPLITDAAAWQWVGSVDDGGKGVGCGIEYVNSCCRAVGLDVAQHEFGSSVDGYGVRLAVNGVVASAVGFACCGGNGIDVGVGGSGFDSA